MVAGTNEDALGASFIDKLPNELHDMLSAGLSNAVKRFLKNYFIPIPIDIDCFIGSEDEYDIMADCLWNGLCEPAPQMKRFIRHNRLRQDICEGDLASLRSEYGRWISVKLAHRIFEQEVYDFGRSIGLSKKSATGHVIKARKRSSKRNVDMLEMGDYDSTACKDLLDFLETYSEPEEPDHMYVSESEIEKAEQFLARFNSKAEMKAADKTKEEKTDRDGASKVPSAELQAQKETWRQAERKIIQGSGDHGTGQSMVQTALASNPGCPAQVQPTENHEKRLNPKKKGRKRKSKLELSIQLEEPSEEHVKHKKGRKGTDVRDAVSKEAKRKKDVGPEQSPFFQRSSNPKVKKDAAKKAEQPMDFQSPMMQ